MFRSATFKLTMWYLAIVMAISLIFSTALYHITSQELNKGLHSESQRIYDQFPVFHGDPRFQPGHDIDSSNRRILWRLAGFNILVLLGAGYASYLLARRTLEPIEAAHEQQKRFTADVSHELRTPLTALKMESEVTLLNSRATANDLRATLNSNLEEVAKMEVLINNLLRLTKLDAHELQHEFINIKLNDLLDEALRQIQPQAEAKGVKIERKVTDYTIWGDRDSLIQLLVTFLDNAVKYSQPGGKVTVSASKTSDSVAISVEDHGMGIKKKDLNHVFDRFYRADESRNKTTHEGHGLGLSIAKTIADVHHGTITISSKPDDGTTVTIQLPTAKQ